MTYWPGTKIRRSTGNAFDWRGDSSSIANSADFKRSQHSSMVNAGNGANQKKTFTIYSKARKSK